MIMQTLVWILIGQRIFHREHSTVVDGKIYTDKIRYKIHNVERCICLDIPTDRDRITYTLDKLNNKQTPAVLAALDTIIKIFDNNPTYVPLCTTVQGAGGYRNSFIINILVALLRR